MASSLSQVEVGERLLAGEPLPSFDEVVAQLRAARNDEAEWAVAVRAVRQIERGVEAAIAWEASHAWVTDEAVAQEALALGNADVVRALGGALQNHIDGCIERMVAEMASSPRGADALLLASLSRRMDGRFSAAHQLDRTIDDVRSDDLAEAMDDVGTAVVMGAITNAEPIQLPLAAVRDSEVPDEGDRLAVAARSAGLLGQQTGLTAEIADMVRDDLALPVQREERIAAAKAANDAWSQGLERAQQVMAEGGEPDMSYAEIRPFHPERTQVVPSPSPHLEYTADDGDGTTHLSQIDVGATTAVRGWTENADHKTLAEVYRDRVGQDLEENTLHSGCPADIPLRGRPGAPRISAVRMLYQRCARLAAATGSLSPTGVPHPGALSPTGNHDPLAMVATGDDAFLEVLDDEYSARADIARTPTSAARLIAACPYGGRRARRVDAPGAITGAMQPSPGRPAVVQATSTQPDPKALRPGASRQRDARAKGRGLGGLSPS